MTYLELRALSRQDLPQVLALISELQQGLNLGAMLSWTPESLQAELYSAQGLGLFTKQGQLVALVFYRSLGEFSEIDLIATALRFQRQGLAAKLIQALPGQELWLEVHEANSQAIEAYKKMGFVENARRSAYYQDGRAALMMSFKK